MLPRYLKFRFSLRQALAFTFVVCICMGAYVAVWRSYQRTKATVEYFEYLNGTCVVKQHGPSWLTQLGGSNFAEHFGDVVEVNVDLFNREGKRQYMRPPPYSWADEWFLEHIAHLTDLQVLTINGVPISDHSVDELVQLSQLRELHVTDTRISREGCVRLREALPDCVVTWSPFDE